MITQLLRAMALVLFISLCQVSYADNTKTDAEFISIADIHFDPFAGCVVNKHQACPLIQKLKSTPYQQWENVFEKNHETHIAGRDEDTNYPLLKTTLQQLKQIKLQKNPIFVLVIGDIFPHDFRESYKKYAHDNSSQSFQLFARKHMQFIVYELGKIFPDTDLYYAVGNNDTYSQDYKVVPNGLFLKDAMMIWSTSIKNKNNIADLRSTFSKAGYYEVTLPQDDQHKIIILNTVLFTDRIHSKAQSSAALEQLNWLHDRLVDAAQHHQKVMLVFHIPYGIDVLATVTNSFTIQEFWQSEFNEKFEAVIKPYADIITDILPAHIHVDTLQMFISKDLANIPVIYTPAISPIFGNNPGFKLMTLDLSRFRISHTVTYYYSINADIPNWQLEYSMNQAYTHYTSG